MQVQDDNEEPAAEETPKTPPEGVTEEVQSEEETWEDKEGSQKHLQGLVVLPSAFLNGILS